MRSPYIEHRLDRRKLTETNSIENNLFSLLFQSFFTVPDKQPPILSITGQSTSKISDQLTKNNCLATFVSNQNLTQWEARAGGSGVGSGDLVASGGAVLAETEFSVYYSNLTWGDIVYRINVYGKNEAGVWSAYE